MSYKYLSYKLKEADSLLDDCYLLVEIIRVLDYLNGDINLLLELKED